MKNLVLMKLQCKFIYIYGKFSVKGFHWYEFNRSNRIISRSKRFPMTRPKLNITSKSKHTGRYICRRTQLKFINWTSYHDSGESVYNGIEWWLQRKRRDYIRVRIRIKFGLGNVLSGLSMTFKLKHLMAYRCGIDRTKLKRRTRVAKVCFGEMPSLSGSGKPLGIWVCIPFSIYTFTMLCTTGIHVIKFLESDIIIHVWNLY